MLLSIVLWHYMRRQICAGVCSIQNTQFILAYIFTFKCFFLISTVGPSKPWYPRSCISKAFFWQKMRRLSCLLPLRCQSPAENGGRFEFYREMRLKPLHATLSSKDCESGGWKERETNVTRINDTLLPWHSHLYARMHACTWESWK